MAQTAQAKELVTQVAIQVMTELSKDATLTGKQKHERVCEIIAGLDNGVPFVGMIPDQLEAKILDFGWDKLASFAKTIDIGSFCEKHFQRIKYIFKR